ncbi:MAG: type II toxin-antitoxin system HicB family antitoxin [candidate division NC10 bacterium]|nr:type II toxin-antitoxin system HicB family antitoxin [candidate division NC10 bacterium]MBI4841345.1 type II toxin-antitoxin system HicB family antitoxin [candidate division NC10 bacterium]
MSSGAKVKSFLYTVVLDEEDDGRWSAVIPALPGCNAWGSTRDEVLTAIREAAQAYVDVLREDGRLIPVEADSQVVEVPLVSVTV